MNSSTEENLGLNSCTRKNPPLQFGLKVIFVLTAIAAVLAGIHRVAGLVGVLIALIAFYAALLWRWLTENPQKGNRVIELGAIVAVLLIFYIMFAPTGDGERPGWRKSQCLNNLRNIGLALQEHMAAHDQLPPAFTTDSNGKPLMSWRTAILPRIGCEDIFSDYRKNEPWDSANNKKLSKRSIEIFQCPSDSGATPKNNLISYVAVIAPGSAWVPGRGVKLSEIKDKLSDTILLIEVSSSGIAWAEPRDLDLSNLPPGITTKNLLSSLSNHTGGFHAAFASGHVEFIPSTIPWSQFMAILTIAGGELVDRSTW